VLVRFAGAVIPTSAAMVVLCCGLRTIDEAALSVATFTDQRFPEHGPSLAWGVGAGVGLGAGVAEPEPDPANEDSVPVPASNANDCVEDAEFET
jgi:hypothetical protein